jgi:hypothetical protein
MANATWSLASAFIRDERAVGSGRAPARPEPTLTTFFVVGVDGDGGDAGVPILLLAALVPPGPNRKWRHHEAPGPCDARR